MTEREESNDEWLRESVRLGPLMKVPSRHRLANRFYESALSIPKMFLCAFLWEGFGLGSGYASESVDFYFITGLGGGVGVLVGHLLAFAVAKGKDFKWQEELTRGSLYGISVFLGPATLWQKIVNDTDEWGWSFTGAFFFMWLIASLTYFASMTFFRAVAEIGSKHLPILKVVEPPSLRIWSDFSLSISVGLGDAFFMGTVPDQFNHNWLAPAFGVHDDTETFLAMLKSGLSVLIGFLIMQVVENLIFKSAWTDDAQDDAVASKEGSPATDKSIGLPPMSKQEDTFNTLH
eukprot:gene10641-11797_t